jgi:hypothetical protein
MNPGRLKRLWRSRMWLSLVHCLGEIDSIWVASLRITTANMNVVLIATLLLLLIIGLL